MSWVVSTGMMVARRGGGREGESSGRLVVAALAADDFRQKDRYCQSSGLSAGARPATS